jgi:hypothetical protein
MIWLLPLRMIVSGAHIGYEILIVPLVPTICASFGNRTRE